MHLPVRRSPAARALRRIALALPLALAAWLPADAPAQAPAGRRPQVLVLGTPHLANPGRDAANQQIDDVLAPKRQAELERLAELVAAWRPTKIAVEVPAERDSMLQAAYARYRRDEAPASPAASRSETRQIGMRVARRLGHERLYPVDVPLDLDVNGVFRVAAQSGEGAFVQRAQREIGAMMARADSVLRHGTLVDVVRAANAPAADSTHAFYLQAALIGAPGKDSAYVGARMAADWYARNLMIFANVARLATSPDDRVLVIIGAGHGKLLRDYLRESRLVEVVPAERVLGAR